MDGLVLSTIDGLVLIRLVENGFGYSKLADSKLAENELHFLMEIDNANSNVAWCR